MSSFGENVWALPLRLSLYLFVVLSHFFFFFYVSRGRLRQLSGGGLRLYFATIVYVVLFLGFLADVFVPLYCVPSCSLFS